MAARTSTKETLELQDGTVVELRPLNIKNYRAFQKVWDDFVSNNENATMSDQLDFLLDLTAVCLTKPLGEEKVEDREWLEDALDSETINYIIKVCAGVDLNPENAMVTAIAAQSGLSSN